jgi:hypothetical protein
MSTPERIQRSRKAGSRKPLNTVCVDRANKTFGNPFKVEVFGLALALGLYKFWIMAPEQGWLRALARQKLRGKNLACWCKPGSPCHADILLEIANGDALEEAPPDEDAKGGEAR